MNLFKDVTGIDSDYLSKTFIAELATCMYAAAWVYDIGEIDYLISNLEHNPAISQEFLPSAGISESRFGEKGYIDSQLKRMRNDQEEARKAEDAEIFWNITKCLATFSVCVIAYILEKYPQYRKEYFDKSVSAWTYAANSDAGRL